MNNQERDAKQKLKDCFEGLLSNSFSNWHVFEQEFEYQQLSINQHWIKAGDVCNELCFIVEGLLRVYYIDQAGNEVNQHFYQANEVIAPISALMNNEACQYYIQAIEPTQVMLADYHQLSDLGRSNTQWLQLEIKLLQTVFIKNSRREARLLLGNAEQRYKWFQKEFPELNLKLPQYHVASFLGITPVSLSRLKKKIDLN